jgi:hypothetical protein
MTIQMAAESNDIIKVLLRDTEDGCNNLWKVAASSDTATDRINNAKNSGVGKINVEIGKASKDNDDHVHEVMQNVTDTVVKEMEDITKHFDDGLQDTQIKIVETNDNNTQQILLEQNNNFSRTMSCIDESMNKMLEEVKNKDTDIILQAQEKNLSKVMKLLITSISNVIKEVRTIKRSTSFDDLKQFQQPPEVKETRRRRP